MSQQYFYTDDDRINPVYCVGCRAHIPRTASNAGRGLCPTCISRLGQPGGQPPYIQQQAPQPQPGMGSPYQQGYGQNLPGPPGYQPYGGPMCICPQCHSPHVVQYQNSTSNGAKTTLITIGCVMSAISLFCFWPLLLVGIILLIVGACLPSNQMAGLSKSCQSCGFRWIN